FRSMATLTCDLRARQSWIVTICGVFGGILALAIGGSSFEDHFSSFLHVISYYIMPWLAILAIAYFKIYRNGDAFPRFSEFYKPDGAFKGIIWPGMGAFIVGVVVSIPFMANDYFTGPIGEYLNGADLSYFVSGALAAILFSLTGRPVRSTSDDVEPVTEDEP